MCNLPPPDAPTSATVLPAGIFKLKSVNTLCHINNTAISNIYVYADTEIEPFCIHPSVS